MTDTILPVDATPETEAVATETTEEVTTPETASATEEVSTEPTTETDEVKE